MSENKETLTQQEIDELRDSLPAEVEIVGIRFKKPGKIYYFLPEGIALKQDDNVIVKTARGLEYGTVAIPNRLEDKNNLVLPIRSVVRRATKADDQQYESNLESEKEAFKVCQEKIDEHKLDMKLVDVEYTFDNNKLLFYFTADGRIDFRELVKDLASVFKTRIELRQIGIRDETKLMGGLGVCGRPFCCKSFLSEFVQVSIKMAKEQNLSLNSSKISGACGKLMCCLRYEHETYEDAIKRTPKLDSKVNTPDGVGVVIETNPLAGLVRVRIEKDQDKTIKLFKCSEVAKI
ncbi:MAG: stage 0 sporulation family protein [Clostridia bacterium]|nr:stage 0 sporulation family protein [Clostridia bacterium]